MTIARKSLCFVYGLIACVALIGTWANNFHYLDLGYLGANVRFWQETFANPASRSITVDIMFLTLAIAIWMLMEARRLGMRFAWLYLILGALIAISVTLPVFLLQRERAMAARDRSSSAGTLAPADVVGLLVLALVSFAYAIGTLVMPLGMAP